MAGSPTLSRRLLLGAAAGAALGACHVESEVGDKPHWESRVRPLLATTVDELLDRDLFHVAHRGSQDTWTEHTADAYLRSWHAGADAVEISVNATSDGVLVCHHDRDVLRLTGVDRTISSMSWSELEPLRQDARMWLGPSAPRQPVSRLADVLDLIDPGSLIFIEDKQGTNTRPLLDLMDAQDRATDRFVWKQWASASQVVAAQRRGYRTWGYLDSGLLARAEKLAPRFDSLGVPVAASDRDIDRICSIGPPVVAWSVHTHAERQRLTDLGVRGMMCANVPYLLRSGAGSPTDAFATGLRSAGDLPDDYVSGWQAQPSIDPVSGTLTLNGPRRAYTLGSMAPVRPFGYVFGTRLRWPETVPDAVEHAGISFALSTDAPYVVLEPTHVAGYHVIVRVNGEVALLRREAGAVTGTPLGSVFTRPVTAREWIGLEVQVNESVIRVARVGQPEWSFEVTDSRHRGAWVALNKNYPAHSPVEFAAVSVRPT